MSSTVLTVTRQQLSRRLVVSKPKCLGLLVSSRLSNGLLIAQEELSFRRFYSGRLDVDNQLVTPFRRASKWRQQQLQCGFCNHGYFNVSEQLIKARGIGTASCVLAKADKDADESLGKADKILRVKLKAQRLDAVLKAGLALSRNKIEKAFYEDRVRINGERPEKKSQTVFEGDEIDIVRGYNDLNPENFIDVSRVEIMEMADDFEGGSGSDSDDDETRIPAVLKRSKLLTIRNYSPPWKGNKQD